MSKKTIPFTMPSGGPRRREPTPIVLDGLTGESVPFVGAGQPDDWVRDRNSRHDVDPLRMAGSPPLRPLAVGASVTINLAAERNLMEAMALSFLVPFALGWFWFVNAMAQRHRMWGV